MIIYGRRVVYEYLRSKRKPKKIYLQKGIRLDDDLLNRISGGGYKVVLVSQRELNKITSTNKHQGIAMEVDEIKLYDRKEIIALSLKTSKPILVLDHINDVRNAGALIRSAEGFGFAGVIMPQRRAAPISPALIKTSAGAIFHIKVSRYNIIRFLQEFKKAGGWVIALDLNGRDIKGIKVPTPFALVLGSEGEGISKGVKDQVDITVKIPMYGKVESLNVSVAGGIAMFYLTI